MNIPILFEDEDILIVDKPRDIHVHPTKLSRNSISLLDILEDKYSIRLFPVHRIDYPVSGTLMIAKSSAIAAMMGKIFRDRYDMDKRYHCLVRGWMVGYGSIDRPLKQSPGKPAKEASTEWRIIKKAEVPWSDGIFPTSRYTLIECLLRSGRYHQIRRHLSGESHPILGDVAHGDNRRNRIWKRYTNIEGIMLRAMRLGFIHPRTNTPMMITAPIDERFKRAAALFGWKGSLY